MILPTTLRARDAHGRRRAVLALAVAGTCVLAGCASPAGSAAGSSGSGSGGAATLTGGGTDEPRIDADPSPGSSADPTPSGGQPWDDGATRACERALDVAGIGGLGQVAQTADDAGLVSLWSGGEGWAVCDVPTHGETTVVSSGERARLGPASFRLQATSVSSGAGVRYVGGGPLPWPVNALDYRFPDGEGVAARFVQPSPDAPGWWVLTYTATDGPLAEGDATPDEPLFVSVSAAAAEGYRIPWQKALRTP